jgi:hypothetical protein
MNARLVPFALVFALALPALAVAQSAPPVGAAPAVDAEGPIPDIRDIRDPLAPPARAPWERYVLFGAIALASLGLAYGLWRGARRTLRAPHRVALADLRTLEKRAAELAPEQLTDGLADVVRVYVERRFEVHAPRRTTEELFAELATHPALRDHGPQLMDLLTRCDRIRFACDRADVIDRRALVAAAESFVRDSTKRSTGASTSSFSGALS